MAASDLVVCHLGAPGSGKTWRMKVRAAAAYRLGLCDDGTRIVVADVKREWPSGPRDPARGPLTSGSKVPMGRLTGRIPKPDAELPPVLICRPGTPAADAAAPTNDATRAWFDELCRFATKRQRVVLVVPEVWRYAREQERMVPALEYLAHEHRHANVALWIDAQDIASVKKELLKPCGWWFLHGTAAYEDLGYLNKKGGPALGGNPQRGQAGAVMRAMELNRTRGPGHFVLFNAAQPFPPYHVRGPDGAELPGEVFT